MTTFRDKMKARYEQLKSKSGGSGQTFFMKLEKGKSYHLRVVPYRKDENGDWVWFYERGTHFLANSKVFNCPRIASNGDEKCPICEKAFKFYRRDETDERKKAFGKKLFPNNQYIMNVCVIDRNGADPDVKVVRLSKSAFLEYMKYFSQEGWGDMVDPKTGNNFTIDVTSTGPLPMNVKYTIIPDRSSSPIGTGAEWKEIYSNVHDLEEEFGKLSDEEEMLEALEESRKNADFMAAAMRDFKQAQAFFAKKDNSESEHSSSRKSRKDVDEDEEGDDEGAPW